MTINHQPNCIFFFLLNLQLRFWLIHACSFLNFVILFWVFPIWPAFFSSPLLWHRSLIYLAPVLFQRGIALVWQGDIWSCIHACSISVNLNYFKRHWSEIQKFEKTFAPFPFKELFWLYDEVWKSSKATLMSLTNEISKLEYKLWQALRGNISLQIIQKMVNVVKSNKRIMCHIKFIGKGKHMTNLVGLVDHKVFRKYS